MLLGTLNASAAF